MKIEVVNRIDDEYKMHIQPVGKYTYPDGYSRPITKKYKLFVPKKWRGKTLKAAVITIFRALAYEFISWVNPETEEEFFILLFGGIWKKWGFERSFCIFPYLRRRMRNQDPSIYLKVSQWQKILQKFHGLSIDMNGLCPSEDLPINDETMPTLWQYKLFKEGPSVPPCKDVTFPVLTVNLSQGLIEEICARREKNEWWRFNKKRVVLRSKSKQALIQPLNLDPQFIQCTYGIDFAARTIDGCGYYPVIGEAPDGKIQICPREGKCEQTASAAPAVPLGGWLMIFPKDTRPEFAAMFLEVYGDWDGLRVLDVYTCHPADRVPRAFYDVKRGVKPRLFASFENWLKAKEIQWLKTAEPIKEKADAN